MEICDHVDKMYPKSQMTKMVVQLCSCSVVLHSQPLSNSVFSSVKGGNICSLSTFQSHCTTNWIFQKMCKTKTKCFDTHWLDDTCLKFFKLTILFLAPSPKKKKTKKPTKQKKP